MFNNYIEERVLDIANFTLKTGSTVRDTARLFGVSKSTVHRDLSKRLPIINQSLFTKVNKVLRTNFEEKHIRGGVATKEKYASLQG